MNPIIAGALISGGASIGGGMLSNFMGGDAAEDAAAAQKWYAKNMIQMRVKDAQKAGVHPLFALGAPAMGGSPVSLPGDALGPALADAGQNIGNAVARMQTGDMRKRTQLELALLASQVAETDARRDMYLSESARNRAAGQIGGLGLNLESSIPGQTPNPPGVGVYDVKPSQTKTSMPGDLSITAGPNDPYYQRMDVGPGLKMLLPRIEGDSPGEVLNEMGPIDYLGLLLKNQVYWSKRGDPDWLHEYVSQQHLGGVPGAGRKKSGLTSRSGRDKVRKFFQGDEWLPADWYRPRKR